MKSFLFIICTISFGNIIAQQEKIEVDGAIQIGNSDDPTPEAGTIRWTGSDFEGYNGSEWVSLTGGTQYIYDIDNNKYRITEIGSQTWMADNLRVTRYNDGTPIPLITDGASWNTTNSGAYTWYTAVNPINNESRGADSGALYNFYVVSDTNSLSVCPVGWHIPTKLEWETLAVTLGGESVAGGKLKATGLAFWAEPNDFATNESGFNAVPAGKRLNSGVLTDELTSTSYWWSQTEFEGDPTLLCYGTSVDYLAADLIITFYSKQDGHSIRCIKD